MDTPAEKDYIDAKLQAVIERLNGEAKAHQIATDTRRDRLAQPYRCRLLRPACKRRPQTFHASAGFPRADSDLSTTSRDAS
jgi:hypothetical protein